MDMGGVKIESPNIMQSSLQELQDLVRFQDEALNTSRVNRWQQLVASAEEKGIQLTFQPYRKTMLRIGTSLPEDLYVVVQVPGFEWPAKKFATHTPRPNTFYFPGPPLVRGGGVTPQGNLSGVVTVCLVAPPLETMTVQLSVSSGTGEFSEEDVKPSNSVEQDFWETALTVLDRLIPQIDATAERQLAGVRVTMRDAGVESALQSPYTGEIREIKKLGGINYIGISTSAIGIPVGLYQAVFEAAKVYRKEREREIEAAGGDIETDRGLEEFNESIENLRKKASAISRQPTSAGKAIDSMGFNADAALTHINILKALQDNLYRRRQQSRDMAVTRNISAAIENLEAQMRAPRAALDEIPALLRSPSNEDRARGYGQFVPLTTQMGKYEYSKAKRALQRVEYLTVPANHEIAVEVGQPVAPGLALTKPLDVAPTAKIEVETVMGDSSLQPRRVGIKNVTPVKAQVTLFFQPRPVTNEDLKSVQSRMFPIPARTPYDRESAAVTAEIEQALEQNQNPDWFQEEVERLGRGLTNEEAQAVMTRRVRQNIAFAQIETFIAPINAWLSSYYEPFVDMANDAFMAAGKDAIMSKEEFGERYYSAQGSDYPGMSFLPDLVEKGLDEAETPRVRERARAALMRPSKQDPMPGEPSEEAIAAKAVQMTAPRPTAQPVFYYLLSIFDASGQVVWEAKVPLETIPLTDIIPDDYKVKGRGKISAPLDATDPATLNYLPGVRRSGLSAVERRAVAAQARFASWVPEPGATEEEQRGELIGTLMAQERVTRRAAGREEGPVGRLGIVYGRDLKPSTATYRPFQEGVAHPSESRQTTGRYSALELRDMGVDATAVFQHVPENRFDTYLNYLIPRGIAESEKIDRPAAIGWAVREQERVDGLSRRNEAPRVASEESRAKIAKLLGRSSGPASITSKENPMASRLMNNARYRQLAEKTGRFMGHNLRRNSVDDDDFGGAVGSAAPEVSGAPELEQDELQLLRQAAESTRRGAGVFFDVLVETPNSVFDFEAAIGGMDVSEGRPAKAALDAFKKSGLYRETVALRDAARSAGPSAPSASRGEPSPAAPKRRKKKEADAAAAAETGPPPEPPRRRRRSVAAPPMAEGYVFPEAEEAPRGARSSAPQTPEGLLAVAEQELAAALNDASAAYGTLYELLRDPRSGSSSIEGAKQSFESSHAAVAAALLRRNEKFSDLRGSDALLADLSARHRRMMERATAAFARGPDAVNAKLTPKVREDLLLRLASELGYDGTPLISPDRLLAKRGLDPIQLTSPEEAAAASETARRSGGPPVSISPFRYSATTAPSMDAALIAARGQGAMRRLRPKPTATMILQLQGAKGSQNIQPEFYTAPKEVLDRGFDRVAGVPKRAVILWMSPGSDHIIRYTTGPAPMDEGGRMDVEMVGQFAQQPGQTWQDVLNVAMSHSVAWLGDIDKRGRAEKYDVWFGKSGWPYLYRLHSARSPAPAAVPTLLKRMEDMGLTSTGETPELLRAAQAKSKTAQGNIVNWVVTEGENFNPVEPGDAIVQSLLDDARSYQAAIDRTRKTRAVGDVSTFGKDLFSIYEEGEMVGKYAAGTEAAFASDSEMAPILVVPPKIYDGEGRSLGSATDGDTLTNAVYQAVREAVQPTGKHDLTIVDGNMFSAQRSSVVGALGNPDGLKNLTLTNTLQLRARQGSQLVPCPLVAAIQFAAEEGVISSEIASKTSIRTGEPRIVLDQIFTITVVLPDTYRSQAAMLSDLPRSVLGRRLPTMEQEGSTVDLIRVRAIFSGATAGDVAGATANALETALAGSAGAILIADVPDAPSTNDRSGAQVDNYLFFNPPLAGQLAKVVAANFGSISVIKIIGPAAPGHKNSFKELIVAALNKRLRSEIGGDSIPFATLKPQLSALAKKFRVPPDAFMASMAQYAGQDVGETEIQDALSRAAWSRMSRNNWNTLVIADEGMDRDQDRPISENPYRRNNGRRTRIDMASRFMRQMPWMWPDR